MQKWEYCTVSRKITINPLSSAVDITWNPPDPEKPSYELEKLNHLGLEGWELVSVYENEYIGRTSISTHTYYYFKRPLPGYPHP